MEHTARNGTRELVKADVEPPEGTTESIVHPEVLDGAVEVSDYFLQNFHQLSLYTYTF